MTLFARILSDVMLDYDIYGYFLKVLIYWCTFITKFFLEKGQKRTNKINFFCVTLK